MTGEMAIPADELAEAEASRAPRMDEDSFRAFYGETARPLWRYITRITGDGHLAEDLLQESYCRLLASSPPDLAPDRRRSYLFRIATNLVRDAWRAGKSVHVPLSDTLPDPKGDASGRIQAASDLAGAFTELKLQERQLLWLAYIEGLSHREIAAITGLGEASIRPLLFKARHKLAEVLMRQGFHPERPTS